MGQQGLQCRYEPIRRGWHPDPGLQQQSVDIWRATEFHRAITARPPCTWVSSARRAFRTAEKNTLLLLSMRIAALPLLATS